LDVSFESTQDVLRIEVPNAEQSSLSLRQQELRAGDADRDRDVMTDAFEVDGRQVLNWVKTLGHHRARKILQGCLLDDGKEDQLLEITDMGSDFALQCRIGNTTKRIPPSLLSTSTVIDQRQDFPLQASLNLNKSPLEKERETAERFLRSRGISTAGIASSNDLFLLVAAAEDDQDSRLPTRQEQDNRYEAFKRSSLLREGAKIIERWMALALQQGNAIDGSILIKLAYCLRHTGNLERALDCTSAITAPTPRIQCFGMQRAILATERAAILMDFFEVTRQAEYLADARRTAGMAFAIYASAKIHSPELDAVYDRLRSLERKA
jgi:hypothetical protein